jgi:hypothetical protein
MNHTGIRGRCQTDCELRRIGAQSLRRDDWIAGESVALGRLLEVLVDTVLHGLAHSRRVRSRGADLSVRLAEKKKKKKAK